MTGARGDFSIYTKVSHRFATQEALRGSVVELPLPGVRLLGTFRHPLPLRLYPWYTEYLKIQRLVCVELLLQVSQSLNKRLLSQVILFALSNFLCRSFFKYLVNMR